MNKVSTGLSLVVHQLVTLLMLLLCCRVSSSCKRQQPAARGQRLDLTRFQAHVLVSSISVQLIVPLLSLNRMDKSCHTLLESPVYYCTRWKEKASSNCSRPRNRCALTVKSVWFMFFKKRRAYHCFNFSLLFVVFLLQAVYTQLDLVTASYDGRSGHFWQ